ncbi:E3 ubiquitin-protein ligase RNF13-like isoform X1 [Diorhabda sublineata]|uniref:E3 ubiquitin-protein ligase RNF13-like isoform X1 n=2 Tax=Diorhabda sublineata TaxID=1163346 RepID=UPI0024E0B4A6|nr:E3 ubiquitin-protein ligase RNF13-like isoform X1 [Diorhabda sublineata]
MIYKCLLGLIFASLLDKSGAEIYAIKYESQFYREEFTDKPALFGPDLKDTALAGMLIEAYPVDACTQMLRPTPDPNNETGKLVVLVRRFSKSNNCTFEQKVRISQAAGYSAVIVYNVGSDELISMGANNRTGIFIPSVFVSEKSGLELLKKYANSSDYFIIINGDTPFDLPTHLLVPFSIVVGICFIVMIIFMIWKFIKDRRRQRRHRLPKPVLNKIPTHKFQKGDPYETCVICLEDYVDGEKLRILPCNHAYHTNCIDPWLTKNRRVCPICKRSVWGRDEVRTDSDTDESETDDTSPLLNSSNNVTQGGTFQEQRGNPFQRILRSVSQASGAAAANLVSTSDHHSINGDYISINSASSDSREELFRDADVNIEASTSSVNPFEENVVSVQVDAFSENSSMDSGAHA